MTAAQRDTYTAKIKHQLDALNDDIDSLERKGHEANQAAHARYAADLAKVREESAKASAKLAELKASGESSWDAMVAEMEKIRDAFSHSYKDFKAQVKAPTAS